MLDLVKKQIETLRQKLLDLTNRNSLLNFKHSPRSRNHIRLIDELPDILFERLQTGRPFFFKSLPEPEDEPRDEKTEKFKIALEEARYTDEAYIEQMKSLENDDSTSLKQHRKLERELKDKVRQQLEMPPRKSLEVLSIEDFAREHDLEPSYDLPSSESNIDAPERHLDDYLQTLLLREDMDRKLSGIRDIARTNLQERGIDTLFCAFGFLEWFESQSSERKLHAPLFLLPIDIDRKLHKGRYLYSIKSVGDDPEINATLAEKLARDFNLELPEFREADTPDNYFARVTERLSEHAGWRVRRFVTVGHFAFARLVIFKDIDPDNWGEGSSIPGAEIVSGLFSGVENQGSLFAEEYEIDEPDFSEIVPHLVADADSSQHSALIDILSGRNVVVQGPPGTGKSQTIVNLIAAAMEQGKSILFVAEKMAALEVVKKRLDDAGIGEFCLELHSTKARKKDVLDALMRRLNMAQEGRRTPDIEQKKAQLRELRTRLTSYSRQLNRPYGALGKTVHDILWAQIGLGDRLTDPPNDLEQLNINNLNNLDIQKFERSLELLRTYRQCAEIARGSRASLDQHPWRGVLDDGLDPFQIEELIGHIEIWRNAISALADSGSRLESETNIRLNQTPTDLRQFANVISSLSLDRQRLNYALFSKLGNETARHRLREFLHAIKSFRAQYDNLSKFFAGAPSEDATSRLGDLAVQTSGTKLDQHTVGELPQKRKELDGATRDFEIAISKLKQASTAIGFDLRPTLGNLRLIVRSTRLLKEIDLRLLARTAREARDGEHWTSLESGQDYAAQLIAERTDLEKTFHIGPDCKPEHLRADAAILLETGLVGKLISSDFRKAKVRFQSVSIDDEKRRPAEMAIMLSSFADHIERVSKFDADELQNQACGSSFRGIATAYDELLKVNVWARNVRNTIPALEPAGQHLLGLILSRDIGPLEQLLSIGDDASFAICEGMERRFANTEDFDLSRALSGCRSKAQDIGSLQQQLSDIGLRNDVVVSRLSEISEMLKKSAANLRIIERNEFAQNLLDDLFHGVLTDVEPIEATLSAAEKVTDTSMGSTLSAFLISPDVENRWLTLRRFSGEIYTQLAIIDDTSKKAIALGKLELKEIFKVDDADNMSLEGYLKWLNGCCDSKTELPNYLRYLRIRGALSGPEHELVTLFETAGGQLSDIEDAYRYVVHRSLGRGIFRDFPGLKELSGLKQSNDQTAFRALDRELMRLSQQKIAAELASRPIARGVGTGPKKNLSELSLIQNEHEKKSRHIPLRNLLRRAGTAIQQMKPCFMMSPLSVSQYLPTSLLDFDLLVIDEASQMRPEFALGAIFRAKQLVVVGDQHQLPPTSFFEASSEIEDDEIDPEEVVDSESILDFSLAAFKPARRLRWHYRSEHPSLIGFSNKEFYNSELILFPSAKADDVDRGVSLIHVDGGLYKGRVNVPEVHAVVDAAVDFMHNHPELSLGIATLNQPQRDLLIEEFDVKFSEDGRCDEYRAKWDGTLSPFFVKNLENVQGDERDAIFISCVFGPDDTGKVYQRFGPINSMVGHRRLNVLFSRAKKRVDVFSSMRPGDIQVSESSHWGVKALRGYLEFAGTGRLEVGDSTDREPDSDFEIWVKEKLEQWGYQVVPQVGVAGFFIDLAVRDPDHNNTYILGIECDGATYHSARSARDRDRLRQEILENLGWRIHRVWSTDWFLDPAGELEKIRERIETLRQHRSTGSQIIELSQHSQNLEKQPL